MIPYLQFSYVKFLSVAFPDGTNLFNFLGMWFEHPILATSALMVSLPQNKKNYMIITPMDAVISRGNILELL